MPWRFDGFSASTFAAWPLMLASQAARISG
jgi:hypothetical protein